MLRLCSVIAVTAGCGFTASPGDPGDDVVDPGAPAPDAAAARSLCDANDPTLRFCVDFEAPITDVVSDLSAHGVDAQAASIGRMDHETEHAAALTIGSTIHVAETPKLDIAQQLALDLWIRPIGQPLAGKKFWMLDNNTQYAASFTEERKARCVIKDRTVDSRPLPADTAWHHVGCTYDGATMKVFIDGKLDGCSAQVLAIPTGGTSGLALGANLSGPSNTPLYDEQFVGGLDDVRVWARSDIDMCAAADKTGCTTTCPE
jgi:hypothetical protein